MGSQEERYLAEGEGEKRPQDDRQSSSFVSDGTSVPAHSSDASIEKGQLPDTIERAELVDVASAEWVLAAEMGEAKTEAQTSAAVEASLFEDLPALQLPATSATPAEAKWRKIHSVPMGEKLNMDNYVSPTGGDLDFCLSGRFPCRLSLDGPSPLFDLGPSALSGSGLLPSNSLVRSCLAETGGLEFILDLSQS